MQKNEKTRKDFTIKDINDKINKLNSEIAPQASRVFVNDILSEGVNSIVRQLYKAFADIDLPSENLNAAMKNRLIMYSGVRIPFVSSTTSTSFLPNNSNASFNKG